MGLSKTTMTLLFVQEQLKQLATATTTNWGFQEVTSAIRNDTNNNNNTTSNNNNICCL